MLTAHSLCWLCRLPLALAHWGFCSRCARMLLYPHPLCPRCGLPSASTTHPCGRCLQKPPPWQQLVAVNDYIAPLSQLVQQFKSSGKPELANALARLLLWRTMLNAKGSLPDGIISVPLWQKRQWRRGFNQSDLLAAALSRWLGCQWYARALRRTRATPVQHHLSARLRKYNLKNAFHLEFDVRGLHIVVVDDVVTTGSTVAEISRLLLRNGAAKVEVWCLCRTL